MGIRQTLGKAVMKAATYIGGDRFYSLTDPALSKLFRGFGNNTPSFISVRSRTDIADAWTQCPPLVAIILGKVQADITGKIKFKYTDSDEEVNLSKQLDARRINTLLAKPNPLQTWRQFRAQQKAYTQAFGFCPVLCIKPVGFAGPESVKIMWNLPPQVVEIETTGKLFFQTGIEGIIKKIEVVYSGTRTLLPIEDIMLLKDSYISMSTEILPDSRITALEYPISNIVAAYKGANVMITKRGALGILSNASKDAAGAAPVKPSQKEALQQDFQRYGLTDEQWQVIITEASLSWQQMAMPVKELMLYEAIEDGTRQCCSVYNFPYGILPKAKNDSFHNKGEDKKSLYQDAIIPEADSDMEVYNEYFRLSDRGIIMTLDYSHLEIFQVSESDKAAALKGKAEAADLMVKANLITVNRGREMLGEKTVAGDDVYYFEWSQKHLPPPPTVGNLNTNPNEPAITA